MPLQQADQIAEQIAMKFIAVNMYDWLPRRQFNSMGSSQVSVLPNKYADIGHIKMFVSLSWNLMFLVATS